MVLKILEVVYKVPNNPRLSRPTRIRSVGTAGAEETERNEKTVNKKVGWDSGAEGAEDFGDCLQTFGVGWGTGTKGTECSDMSRNYYVGIFFQTSLQ